MNPYHNVPPGCPANDTGPGGEDTYTCAGCDKAVHESALDPDSDEPLCSQCAMEQRERVSTYISSKATTTPQAWPTSDDLADARLELDVERAERALAWERAKKRVKHWTEAVRHDLGPLMDEDRLYSNVHRLVKALDELERLEEVGGAS